MKIVFSLFLLIVLSNSCLAQYVIEGSVVDEITHKPLAFVNVILSDKSGGTMTDIMGKYSLKSDVPIDSLLFSYMGYEVIKYKLSKEELNKQRLTINVSMKSTNYTLKEVVFKAGENPAHRIIKKVIENRDKNNPDKLPCYTYSTYNKFFFTVDVDSLIKADSLMSHGIADSTKNNDHKLLDCNYLFIVESVTEKKFLYPDNNKETITASHVSGFKNPSFSILASEMQGFSFYNDYFVLLERNYLNPLSKGSIYKYFFNIEDTTWNGKDTVFIISFKPLPNKNFEGLKGVLYINTNGYAVQNVIVEPAAENGRLTLKIQQQYQQINGERWFPVQLNTDIIMRKTLFNYADLTGIGRTYIKDIKFDTTLMKNQFDDVILDYESGMKLKDDAFWNANRHDSLTDKEVHTYHFIDSVGIANHLDEKLKLLLALGNSRLPLGIFDLNLDKLINENNYEGVRLGMGIHTSDVFSKYFNIGGYYAYGFKDHKNNYGGDASILLYKHRNIRFGVSYANDVLESGSQVFYDDLKSFLNEEFRKFTIMKMDDIVEKKIYISGNFIKYLNASVFIKENHTTATDNYKFNDELPNSKGLTNNFHFTETGIALRYAYKEKFVKAFDQKLSNGTKYPVIWLNITRGFNPSVSGFEIPTPTSTYTKLDFQIEKSFRIRNLGRSSFVMNAGYVNGSVPYPVLFNGKGSYAPIYSVNNLSFYSGNSFQTMGLNEFLSDRFAAIYFTHRFGHLLFKSKKFQPALSIISNAGIGSLSHQELHQGITFSTMNKGFYESGLLINNLFKVSFSRFGIGVFYRYGPYANPLPRNDIYYKISWTFFL